MHMHEIISSPHHLYKTTHTTQSIFRAWERPNKPSQTGMVPQHTLILSITFFLFSKYPLTLTLFLLFCLPLPEMMPLRLMQHVFFQKDTHHKGIALADGWLGRDGSRKMMELVGSERRGEMEVAHIGASSLWVLFGPYPECAHMDTSTQSPNEMQFCLLDWALDQNIMLQSPGPSMAHPMSFFKPPPFSWPQFPHLYIG